MKQFFVSIAVVVWAVAASGCATGGSLPYVVASNAALPYQILAAGGWPYYYGVAGYGNVPVCRLQDLQGLPTVSQPVLVRVDKSRGHRVADIVGGCAVVGGLAGLSGDWQGATYGCATGAGGGLLVSNHEQELCLYLPVPVQTVPTPPLPQQQPPLQQPEPPPTSSPGIRVAFIG
ncbi:MAG: hypothetical protein HYS78_01055 [Parcubacteria group bacterium]|nr:hypothetical protein [Parcubacteria group bacterium]